jgi:uncharacterized glyoxalase superfamily protein PhnB
MIKRLHSTLFFVADLRKTADFYKALDFPVQEMEGAIRIKVGDFTLAFMDEKQVTINKEAGVQPKGLGVFSYIEVENVDEYFQSIKEKGISTSSEPKDWPWGKREFALKDPDGYKLVFYSPVKK